jgi:hypothetical protein
VDKECIFQTYSLLLNDLSNEIIKQSKIKTRKPPRDNYLSGTPACHMVHLKPSIIFSYCPYLSHKIAHYPRGMWISRFLCLTEGSTINLWRALLFSGASHEETYFMLCFSQDHGYCFTVNPLYLSGKCMYCLFNVNISQSVFQIDSNISRQLISA